MAVNFSENAKLERKLKLFDVYAISTGAMFSSGFFLLPGLAAARTGSSVSLAYLVSALAIVPAMLAVAELSTAMPKAGGAYYFLDRSMGAMVGTVGGLGTWVALVLKSAFALIGMGAYLALFVDVPIKPLAIALTVVFTAINLVGAKETSGLQRGLVIVLLGVLAYFVAAGGLHFLGAADPDVSLSRMSPFFSNGASGFLSTVGLVFVSYAGLTKVAAVAEEVRNPDRNLPLGMALSLATAAVVYVVGTLVMTMVLDPEYLHSVLTPVAAAAEVIMGHLPGSAGKLLVVIAAIAAFASTGNAGILSSSRYPLAMARDHLVPGAFARIGRFGTPTLGILASAGLMILSIAFLDVSSVAKLASAAQLLLFAALSLAVVVMREARIDWYVPGYRVPLYPWLPLLGVALPLWLIYEMGTSPALFTLGFSALFMLWYWLYARKRVVRAGAIFHVFERWGRNTWRGLDHELRAIIHEKGLRDEDPLEEVVARAAVVDLLGPVDLREALTEACDAVQGIMGCPTEELLDRVAQEVRIGLMPRTTGVILPHLRISGIEHPQMVLVRAREGIRVVLEADAARFTDEQPVHALIFLVSPQHESTQHLRLLARIAGRIEEDDFLHEWLHDRTDRELKQTLCRDGRFLQVRLTRDRPSSVLIGKDVREVDLPEGAVMALLRRHQDTSVPRPSTRLRSEDELTFVGDPEAIEILRDRLIQAPE